MKKSELTKLALLGMASGLVLVGQPSIEATQEMTLDIQELLAAHKCKGPNGCGGGDLTADRNVTATPQQQDMHENDEMSDDDDADDGDDDDGDESSVQEKNKTAPSNNPKNNIPANPSKKN